MSSRSDVVIIGGGVIGLCSAYYLVNAGAKVVILDKEEIGHGSSLHNAGYLCPSHFVPIAAPGAFIQGLKWMFNSRSPLYIKPRLNLQFLKWAWHFARACNDHQARRAMPVLRDLLVDSQKKTADLSNGMDFGLEHRGLAILFNSLKGEKDCEHELHLAQEVGVNARILNRSELQAQDPEIEMSASGGLYFPGDMHLVPAKLIAALTRYLENRGVEIQRHRAVNAFQIKNGKVMSVATSEGAIEGSEFVLAGGAWSAALSRKAGLKMYLEAGKGYSVTDTHPAVKPSLPYIFQERRVAVTPFSHGLRFAGTMEFAGMNTSINRPRVETMLDAIPHYFKNIPRPDSSAGEVWGGLRPVSPDGLPYLGRYKRLPNLIAATGHAMLGVSLAAVTGSIVCDLIRHGENKSTSLGHDLTLLDPNRYD